ncbi:MAG: hypothetical protein ABIP56_04575 [Dokdonella sp.]
MNLTRFLLASTFVALLTACQTFQPKPQAPASVVASGDAISRLVGDFDNHSQAAKSGSAHWRYSIRQTHKSDWLAWTIQLESPRPLQLALAMHLERSTDGTVKLTPFRSGDSTAATGEKFDPKNWTELAACSLSGRGDVGVLKLSADRSRCATLAPALGELAGLLPMEIVASGNTLQVRSYSDQALAADYRTDAHRARGFGGWAAINGAGPQAKADSNDWHMNRDLRIDSEGGRTNVNFRDGQASGYSLLLETVVVQDGELPLLKLSIVDGAGQVIAYVWSDPDAKRIGINLGWIQVGLQASQP